MRTEDWVGACFFAMLIPAIVVAISGSRASLAPQKRSLWRGCGLSLISFTLVAFGLLSYQFIHNSPKPVVEGNLWDIRELNSDGENSSRFMITDSTGHAVEIRCSYRGPGLVQGERARVRYVAYNKKLIEMEMLSGSYQRWQLRESSGELGYWYWVGIGALCGIFAYRNLAKAWQL